MAITNHDRVGKAMEFLKAGLGPFVDREFKSTFKDRAATEHQRFLDEDRLNAKKTVTALDVSALLKIMWDSWNDVFRLTLGPAERSLVSELRDHRNRWAHQEAFTGDDAYRALDSAGRLLTAVSAPQADDIEKMKTELLRIRFDAPAGGPAVVGFVRPRIHLPAAIERLLTRDEVEAVLIHECRHAARRDNLIRLLHEITLCLLWFHPLVWMTRSRLGLYRELSCDESVIRHGRGEELVAALAKMAHSDGAMLQASASSFVRNRLAYLSAAERAGGAATALIAAAFGAILLLAVVAPVAQAVAAYACALTHGLAP